jgi:hypothetical protein
MSYATILLAFTFGILLLAPWINASYAQIFKGLLPNILYSHQKPHAVKITSPTKDQPVPIRKNLTITGTSIGNATSHCQVSVIVNGIKPYRPALGTGHGSASDYSTWTFTLTSKYTMIKQGPNKITAKYTCTDYPKVRAFYNVNITGVGR